MISSLSLCFLPIRFTNFFIDASFYVIAIGAQNLKPCWEVPMDQIIVYVSFALFPMPYPATTYMIQDKNCNVGLAAMLTLNNSVVRVCTQDFHLSPLASFSHPRLALVFVRVVITFTHINTYRLPAAKTLM
jgi:hypothetical protein